MTPSGNDKACAPCVDRNLTCSLEREPKDRKNKADKGKGRAVSINPPIRLRELTRSRQADAYNKEEQEKEEDRLFTVSRLD